MLVPFGERRNGGCLFVAASEIHSYTLTRSSSLPCVCVGLAELETVWINTFSYSEWQSRLLLFLTCNVNMIHHVTVKTILNISITVCVCWLYISFAIVTWWFAFILQNFWLTLVENLLKHLYSFCTVTVYFLCYYLIWDSMRYIKWDYTEQQFLVAKMLLLLYFAQTLSTLFFLIS